MTANRARALGLALLLATPTQAQEPPAAVIDWLSESVIEPPASAVKPAPLLGSSPAPRARPDRAPRSFLPPPVTTQSLDAPAPQLLGLAPAPKGLPRDFFAEASGQTLVQELSTLAPKLPALRRHLIAMLSATLRGPRDRSSAQWTADRLELLLALGAVDKAADLGQRALALDPDAPTFRRTFDAAMLLGTETARCRDLAKLPGLNASYPARVFCLARGGDWRAAALTLDSAESLNLVTPEQDALLLGFLDPILYPPESLPPKPESYTPLTFRLYEAMGIMPRTEPLPLAFAWANLRPLYGWKQRLRAAERLAEANVLGPGQLGRLYAEGKPSASGGVWARAKAWQDLREAVGSRTDLDAALTTFWAEMARAGLVSDAARALGTEPAGLKLGPDASEIAMRLVLLSDTPERATTMLAPHDARLAFARRLAGGAPSAPPDALSRAVAAGFTADAAPARIDTNAPEALQWIAALKLIEDGAAGDLPRITDGLAGLRALGLDDLARRTALEVLLLPERT